MVSPVRLAFVSPLHALEPASVATESLPLKLTCFFQAHRIITQIVLVGGRVLGRAFTEAYRQAEASSRYAQARQAAPAGTEGARTLDSAGLSLDEACKILNTRPPAIDSAAATDTNATIEPVMERFKRLFDANDPKKGGSFYLQSKVLRARERIELEVQELVAKAERQRMADGNPMYREGGGRGPAPPSPRQQQQQQQQQQP